MSAVVIDTNVGVVANGGHPAATAECQQACIDALQDAMEAGPLVLDQQQYIVEEYERHFSRSGQPGPADWFFLWVHQNQWKPELCEAVEITLHEEREFAEFPADPALQQFHRDDRKFVAAALASKSDPEVLNAVDSDWWEHRDALHSNGVRVRFLCPEAFDRP